jgi:transposase
MGVQIHLSEDQRRAAIALFEVGLGKDAAATRMGVTASATGRLFERWQVRGAGALVARTTKRSFSFEFKLAVVRRYLAGEKAVDLAREFELSSPGQVATWARRFRREGGMRCARNRRAAGPWIRTRRHASRPRWSCCVVRTSGCGRRWPTWENCGP